MTRMELAQSMDGQELHAAGGVEDASVSQACSTVSHLTVAIASMAEILAYA